MRNGCGDLVFAEAQKIGITTNAKIEDTTILKAPQVL